MFSDKSLLTISSGFLSKNCEPDFPTFVFNQTNELRRYFKRVYVVIPSHYFPKFFCKSRKIFRVSIDYRRNLDYENFERGKNIKFYFPRFFALPLSYFQKKNGDFAFKTVDKLIKKENLEFDLIHAHFTYPTGYVGVKLKEKYKKPLVITAHGHDIYDLPFRNEFWQNKIRYILNNADFVITVSNKNLQFIRKLNVKTPTKVIPNGYNDKLFYPIPKNLARKKLNLPINKKIVLTVGSLVEVKGHKYLIRAMKKVIKQRKDVICVIVGSGELKKELEKLTKELNLQDYVKFVEGKLHEEIPLWMNSCDVFVLPSIAEGFPTVLPEILACRKPVVATNVGGIPEIINKEVGILVNPKNPEELAETLNKALEKEWDIQKIGKYAERFTWDKIAKKILEAYEKIFKKVEMSNKYE